MCMPRLGFLVFAFMQAASVISPSMLNDADAAERAFRLSAGVELFDSGLIRFLVPRFSLKHATRVTLVRPGEKSDASLNREGRGRLIFKGPHFSWYFEITAETSLQAINLFDGWLVSETGQKTVAAYIVDGRSPYQPAVEDTAEVATIVEGDAVVGAKIAQKHCARCHAVDDKTRMTTIGSTPSFALMRGFEDWDERFSSFYALRPHPAFILIKDVTPPFDPSRPPPIVPIKMTLDDVEAVTAYVSTMKPADLGSPLKLK